MHCPDELLRLQRSLGEHMRLVVVVCLSLMAPLFAQEHPSLTAIPDPYGLGERLALIDYIKEHFDEPIKQGASLAALKKQYQRLSGQQVIKEPSLSSEITINSTAKTRKSQVSPAQGRHETSTSNGPRYNLLSGYRASQEGDRYMVHATLKRALHERLLDQSRILESTEGDEVVQLHGEFIIDMIATDERAYKRRFRVDRFTRKQKSQQEEVILPSGSHIVITGLANTFQFVCNGMELPPETVKLLELTAPILRDDYSNEDDPSLQANRSVGERWPIDAAATANAMRVADWQPPVDSVSGSHYFRKRSLYKEQDSYFLDMSVRLSAYEFSIPENFTAERSGLTMEGSTIIPADTTGGHFVRDTMGSVFLHAYKPGTTFNFRRSVDYSNRVEMILQQ